MDLWNTGKLILFVAFVIPGFLMLKTSAVLGLQAQGDSTKQIVDAVAYSCINYALLAWPIFAVESSDWKTTKPLLYGAFYATAILVTPVAWALLWRHFRTTQAVQKALPHPAEKPWDFVFRQRQAYWMLITFKDGKQVAGRYDSRSFASAAPSPEQLFLQEAWVVSEDGGFERPRTDSAGILVLGSEVRTVELFNIHQGGQGGN
jgi:hypothetical protein